MYQEKFHDDMEKNTYKQLHLLEQLATAARVKPRCDGEEVPVNPAHPEATADGNDDSPSSIVG